MTSNARLLSIEPPAVPDTSGGDTAAAAAAVNLDVFVDEPRTSQLMALANKVAGVTAVLYAPRTLVEQLVADAKVTYLLRGLSKPQAARVAHVIDRVGAIGNRDHLEAYLTRA